MRASLVSSPLRLRIRPRGGCDRYQTLGPKTSQLRSFHPTRPAKLLNESVLLAHSLLENVHSATSLPWVASIPLTAVIVRSVFVLPLQIWAMSHTNTQAKLSSVDVAWSRYHQKNVLTSTEAQHLDPKRVQERAERAWRRGKRGMYKRWGVRPWLAYAPHLQLPIWLSMMESIRYMVDGPAGILRWIGALTGNVDMELTAKIIPVVESMSTEGGLWFQNLLVADSTWILPIMLSTTILTNIKLGWKVPSREAIAEMPPKRARNELIWKGLRTGLQIAAVLLCPTMIRAEVPAGLLVYWISSTLFATAQTQMLLKFKPPPPVEACSPKDVGFRQPTQLQGTNRNPKTA